MKKSKLIIIAHLFVLAVSCNQNKTYNTKNKYSIVNVNDSIEVSTFINKVDICTKLDFAIDSSHLFVENVGYTSMIINSVTKETNEEITIIIANMGILSNMDERKESLIKQLKLIKHKYCL